MDVPVHPRAPPSFRRADGSRLEGRVTASPSRTTEDSPASPSGTNRSWHHFHGDREPNRTARLISMYIILYVFILIDMRFWWYVVCLCYMCMHRWCILLRVWNICMLLLINLYANSACEWAFEIWIQLPRINFWLWRLYMCSWWLRTKPNRPNQTALNWNWLNMRVHWQWTETICQYTLWIDMI